MALLDSFLGAFRSPRASASSSPFKETGVSGTPVRGGWVSPPPGGDPLGGRNRYADTHSMLRDISIVAAGLRYFLNLTARPAWKLEPPDDTPDAKAAAEFAEEVIYGLDTSWSRVVRRSGSYRFHGFGIHEWTAKRRDDGRIGLASIEPRPQHTITKWDVDENGGVRGVTQTAPLTGREIYLPREKIVYFVDDTLSDSPAGMGWYDHLQLPAQRLRKLLNLETIGFERDLSGIPVGRAPIDAINQAIKAGTLTEEEGQRMVKGLRDFVALKSKEPTTGIVLESQPFVGRSDQGGQQISSTMQWGLELLNGNSSGLGALGNAVRREVFDIALVMGTQSLLIGREGAGSLALSQEASRNLYLNINSSLSDMAEGYDLDVIGPLWALNGLAPELRPTLKVEDASFKDVEAVARVLADMAQAGAVITPDDPAIDDVRDLLGVSRQPEMTPERAGMLLPDPPPEPKDPLDPDAE